MKKQLLLSTILGLTLVMPAFAANVPEGTKLSDNQTYTYWMLDAIKSIDPQILTSVEDSDAARSGFEGRYNEDGDGALVPGVATSYDLSLIHILGEMGGARGTRFKQLRGGPCVAQHRP